MTATTPPADTIPEPSRPAPLSVVGFVADRSQVDAAMAEAFYAQRNFSLTSTALQRRKDRLETLKSGRAKILGKEVTRTAKEYDVHQKGEPYASYLVASAAVQQAFAACEPVSTAALNEALAWAPASVRLYDAHKAAVKAKKTELDGLSAKILAVESAKENLLRRGIGARSEPPPQQPLPGMGDEPVQPVSWMDQGARQTVYDTLSKEMRIIDLDIAKAANSNDRTAKARAEQDKRQLDELLGSLAVSGLLDGLTPDDSEEDIATDELDDELPGEVDFSDPEGEEHEDPTKHPALAPAIEKQASKRAVKKAAKAGGKRSKK